MSKRTPEAEPSAAEQAPEPVNTAMPAFYAEALAALTGEPTPSAEPAPAAPTPDTSEPAAPPPSPLKYRYIGTGAGLPDVPARDIRADEPYANLPDSLYEPV